MALATSVSCPPAALSSSSDHECHALIFQQVRRRFPPPMCLIKLHAHCNHVLCNVPFSRFCQDKLLAVFSLSENGSIRISEAVTFSAYQFELLVICQITNLPRCFPVAHQSGKDAILPSHPPLRTVRRVSPHTAQAFSSSLTKPALQLLSQANAGFGDIPDSATPCCSKHLSRR